jgi:integrase
MKRRGHGEGSLYQRADGRWAAQIDLGWHDGRRVRKTLYATTRREVVEKLTAARRAMDAGLRPTGDRLTVGAYLTEWLEAVEVRPSTLRRYRQIVGSHLVPHLGRVPLAKLSPPDVERMLRAVGERRAARTAHHVRAVLRTALARAVRHGLVARNAAALAEPPHVEHREVQSLDPVQVRRLLEAVRGDRDEALYLTAIATGLRQGELLGLRWTDVDLIGGTVTVRHALQRVDGSLQLVETKTARSRRTVPLPAVALDALRAHRNAQDGPMGSLYVFSTAKGTPLDGTNVTKRLQAILAEAGLPRVTFHALRHTAASLLLAQGVHPRVVMEQLGHSQISLTMNTYSHVIPALERDAADRMNALLTGGTA